jgi:transposase
MMLAAAAAQAGRAGIARNLLSRSNGMTAPPLWRVARRTVAKYRTWAIAQHLLEGELPDLHQLQTLAKATLETTPPPPQQRSSVEAYTEPVRMLIAQGLGPYLIYQKLCEQPDFTGSEAAVWRLVRKLTPSPTPKVTLRIETAPGEVVQVDFGEVTPLIDPATGAPRRTYVFVMVLAWSRHMYAEFVFDQKIPTWLQCHQHAFEFFGGVPQRLVIDNLKSAILKAYARDREPEVVRAYAECAEHYNFLIDPCLPKKPEHKGKVEKGGVGYIQRSFVPLMDKALARPEANQRLWLWLKHIAGEREHGMTHQRCSFHKIWNTQIFRMEIRIIPMWLIWQVLRISASFW